MPGGELPVTMMTLSSKYSENMQSGREAIFRISEIFRDHPDLIVDEQHAMQKCSKHDILPADLLLFV